METAIRQIVPIGGADSLLYERMVVDVWRVEALPGAGGEYVSPDPRFVILLDGATIALSGDGQERPAVCNACFVPAGLPLSGRITTPGRIEHLDIHLDEALLRRVVGPSANLRTALFLPDSAELRSLCALLADECRRPRHAPGYGEALARGVIHEVFHLGTRCSGEQGSPDWLRHVMEHVREGLDGPPSVGDLAAMTGMSRSRFSRRFKELVGVSPYRWVMDNRIRQAQRLLAAGAGLSQVAHEAGFADQAHFSRCFRDAIGLSPGRWIRRHVSSKAEAAVQDSPRIRL